MLLQAAQDLNIDLTKSYLVGDRFRDMEAAKKAGVKGVLVKTGYGQELLQDDGPDKATAESKPDFIAADILEAVKWILAKSLPLAYLLACAALIFDATGLKDRK